MILIILVHDKMSNF